MPQYLLFLCCLFSWYSWAAEHAPRKPISRAMLLKQKGNKKEYEIRFCDQKQCFSRIVTSKSNSNSPAQKRYESNVAGVSQASARKKYELLERNHYFQEHDYDD